MNLLCLHACIGDNAPCFYTISVHGYIYVTDELRGQRAIYMQTSKGQRALHLGMTKGL
jgi:hypothetical protein